MSSEDLFKRFFFGHNQSGFPPMIPPDGHDNQNNNDFDSLMIDDINRIFQEMDQMMKQFSFGHSFGGFGSIGHSLPFAFDSNQAPAIENSSPMSKRDEFLKPNPRPSDKTTTQSPNHQKSFFENFFESIPFNNENFDRNGVNEKFYEDLDEKIAKEGLDKVLREDVLKINNDINNKNNSTMYEFKNHNQQPSFISFGQSCSIRRVHRPDGSIEEIKTIRNSDGNQEKTYTRLIGDKKHSITEKKSSNAIKETEEIFENLDEKNLDDFNRMWNHHNNNNNNKYQNPVAESSRFNINDSLATNNDINPSDSTSKSSSILSKIYSWFR